MATYPMTYPRQNKPPWLLILLLAVVLFGLAIPAVLESAHASLHSEADLIRQCFHDNGFIERWVYLDLKNGLQRDNCLVLLPDGRIGDRVIQYSCKRLEWIELTAYIINDGTLAEAVRVLKARGCTRVYP